jgi:hypothetical protein
VNQADRQGYRKILANEIDLLAKRTGVPCNQFRHKIYASELSVDTSSGIISISFTVPSQFCFILTRLALESIPPVNDPDLTTFDWRSPDIDASGSTLAYFKVLGSPRDPVTLSGYAPTNRPLQLVFDSENFVEFVLNRSGSLIPSDEVICMVAEGFLAPSKVRECLQSETRFLLPEIPPVIGVVANLIINSLKIISVIPAATPSILATVPVTTLSGSDDCILVNDTTAFTLGDDNILYVVDITNLSSPVILSSTSVNSAGSGFYRMVVVDHFLAIIRSNNVPLNKNTLEIFNIANLSAPVSLALYDLMTDFAAPQNCGSILMNGTIAVITADSGAPDFAAAMGFYDFSNLPAVTQIGVTLTDGPGTELDLLDLQDGYAYCEAFLSTSQELRIYNVSNPLLPVLTCSLVLSMGGLIFSQVSNGSIYGITLSTTDKNIYAFDVSNPNANPTLIGSTPVVTNRNFSIRAATDANGSKVYLATRKNSAVPRNRTVQVYNASSPGAMVLLGEVIYSTGGGNTQLALAYGEI